MSDTGRRQGARGNVRGGGATGDVLLESRGDVRDTETRALLKERIANAMRLDFESGGLAYGDMLAFSTDSVAESFADALHVCNP